MTTTRPSESKLYKILHYLKLNPNARTQYGSIIDLLRYLLKPPRTIIDYTDHLKPLLDQANEQNNQQPAQVQPGDLPKQEAARAQAAKSTAEGLPFYPASPTYSPPEYRQDTNLPSNPQYSTPGCQTSTPVVSTTSPPHVFTISSQEDTLESDLQVQDDQLEDDIFSS